MFLSVIRTQMQSEESPTFRYVVTEFAGTSLFKVLREQKDLGHRHILPEHVVFIIYQLLRAVKYIHSGNVSCLFAI